MLNRQRRGTAHIAIVLAAMALLVSVPLAACRRSAAESQPATLVALDARTGDEAWRAEAPNASISAIAAAGDVVLVLGYDACPSSGGTLSGVDRSSGSVLWGRPVLGSGCPTREQLAVAGDTIVVCAAYDPTVQNGAFGLVGLDVRTGASRWIHETPCALDVLHASNGMFFGVSWNEAFALDATTGDQLWTKEMPHLTSSGGASDGVGITVGHTDDAMAVSPYAVSAVDIASGDEMWTQEVVAADTPIFAGDEGVLAVAYETWNGSGLWPITHLVGLDIQTGTELWREDVERDTDGGFVQIAADGSLYTLLRQGEAYSVGNRDLRTGVSTVEQRGADPIGRAESFVVADDGGMVLNEGDGLRRIVFDMLQQLTWVEPIRAHALGAGTGRLYAATGGRAKQLDY